MKDRAFSIILSPVMCVGERRETDVESECVFFRSVLRKKKEKTVKQQSLERKLLMLIFINVEETLI